MNWDLIFPVTNWDLTMSGDELGSDLFHVLNVLRHRSGDAGANAKNRIAELEGDVVQLTAKAEELQRFAQEYMVKTSSDKQKARPVETLRLLFTAFGLRPLFTHQKAVPTIYA